MPFKNSKQRASCYATKGWGGKVNCSTYGKDQKTLPKKVTKKKGK